MLRAFVIGAVLLAFAHGAFATSPLDAGRARRIDADVRAILERTRAPGAAIAVVENNRVVYRKAYGLRDRERSLKADVDTLYEIGSITKQFTAAAILQLQEEGRLDIDDKLAKYLPDAPHAGEITLRQLLSHTSGLPEYLDGPDIEDVATKPATFAQLMARVAGKPLVFAPGSRMTYNNTGYILLGRVIEVVSGESYRDYVRRHLLDRAGMSHTHTVADESKLRNMAVGYRIKDGVLERAPTIHDSVGWSAGDLVSTLDDVAKWSRALADGKIVSAKSYREMTTATAIAQGTSDYGLGLFVDSVRDQPRIGHTGGSFGFTTANEYFPRQHVRIIAFTNLAANPEPGETITNAIFDDLFPEIAAAAEQPARGENAEVSAKTKAFFEGLQHGDDASSVLTARLAAKMKDGLARRLADLFGAYGPPTRYVFKGARSDKDIRWYDYVIEFGPGSRLPFSIGLDKTGKIASISYG